MQRTIYVKDDLWNQIKEEAKKRGIKISELLTESFKSCQLDRIEEKIDELLEGCAGPKVINKVVPVKKKDIISDLKTKVAGVPFRSYSKESQLGKND